MLYNVCAKRGVTPESHGQQKLGIRGLTWAQRKQGHGLQVKSTDKGSKALNSISYQV